MEKSQARRNLRRNERQRQRDVRRARLRTAVERRQARHGSLWWIPWCAGLLILLGGSILTITMRPSLHAQWQQFVRAETFQLRTVEVQGVDRRFAQQIVALLGIPSGTPLIDLDVQELGRRLLEQPEVARVRLMRLPPAHLLIAVDKRIGLALAELPERTSPYLVDYEGRPYAVAQEPTTLTVLKGVADLQPGVPNAQLATAVRVSRFLAQHGLPEASEIILGAPKDPNRLTLVLKNTKQDVLLRQTDYETQLRGFARLLSAGLPEFTKASEIDLRFRNQVILRGFPSSEGGGARGGLAWKRDAVHNRVSMGIGDSLGGIQDGTQG